MTKQYCANCVYCHYSLRMKMSAFAPGFPVGPLCSNHPDGPGQLRQVSPSGICRNYRPRPPAPAQPEETVRRIAMSGGQFVLVDAADYEWLSRYTWSCNDSGYALRREKGKKILMHRQIMQPPDGMLVDHIDGNKRNNCRCNLRVCTRQENSHNRAKRIGSSSRFKGVRYYKDRDKWRAEIWFHGQHLGLGTFDDEVEAARAYDRKAVECFGEFARLNFPEEWPPERRQEVYANRQVNSDAEKGRGRKGKSKKVKGQRRTPHAERTRTKPPQKARRAPRPEKLKGPQSGRQR